MFARASLILSLAVVAACGGGGAPSPQVSLLAPDAAVEVPRGTVLEIRYVDDVAPDSGTTSLYADLDGDPATEGDRFPIATDRAGAGGVEQVVAWDTGAVAGSYFLVAVSERGGRRTVVVTPFAVIVNAPPGVAVLTPAVETIVRPGGRLEVGYVDDDPDDIATTALVLDGDGDLGTMGDQFVLAAARPDQDGAQQGAAVFLETAPDGLYFVVAITTDGKNAPVRATAPGRVRVERATINEIHGPGDRDQAQHVATFADGSYAVAGRFEAPITLAKGTADETALSADEEDIFLARYDPRGRLAWARRVTGPGNQLAGGLWAFPDGSCAVTGTTFDGTAILGEGEPDEARFAAGPRNSIFFIGRYDAAGNLRWARGGGAGSNAAAGGGAVLPGGALAAVVNFSLGPITLNAGLPDARTFAPVGGPDGLLVRYEADGSLGWVARVGGASASTFLSRCAAYADGSVAVVSVIYGAATFGGGEPNETAFPGGAFAQLVLALYAPDGTLRWARRARNDGSSSYWDVRVAATSDGGAAIAGTFNAATTFGPGEPAETTLSGGFLAGFVARYASDGRALWARQIGGAGSDFVTGLAASPAGEVVVAGYTNAPITFGAGEPTERTVVPVSLDLYFAHYDEGDGRFLRVWRFAPASDRFFVRADVASFPDGSLVATATCGPTATFAPGTPAAQTFTSAGGADVVLAVVDRATIDLISE